ncbi:hypothetical protein SKAU_G00162260 [Synaphobranchus kaupii]|uniref:Uncharacterized protein n=1 Tax=Synaphobranchus kaupii TaxID=118154 RepID=A0A9Q1IZ04_SYNKA|nr:hypothetical protein SKAU_G00162260 [Synaphobranchus kaupii]
MTPRSFFPLLVKREAPDPMRPMCRIRAHVKRCGERARLMSGLSPPKRMISLTPTTQTRLARAGRTPGSDVTDGRHCSRAGWYLGATG